MIATRIEACERAAGEAADAVRHEPLPACDLASRIANASRVIKIALVTAEPLDHGRDAIQAIVCRQVQCLAVGVAPGEVVDQPRGAIFPGACRQGSRRAIHPALQGIRGRPCRPCAVRGFFRRNQRGWPKIPLFGLGHYAGRDLCSRPDPGGHRHAATPSQLRML